MRNSENDKKTNTDLTTMLNHEMGRLIDLCKELADTTGEKVEVHITAIPNHQARFKVQRSKGVVR